MKKIIQFIILFILIATIPITVIAGGKSEDEATDSSSENSNNWIGECHYEHTEAGKTYKLDVYFNRKKLSTKISTAGGFVDFNLDDVLNYYNKYKACTNKLYIHKDSLKITFDKANNVGSYNLKSKKFYPENDDPWIVEKDGYSAQCYYSLSTCSSAECNSIDLININFNKEGFNVQVVDSDLKYKSGMSLTMNDGVSQTKFSGWDINLENLQDYYSKNASGCPTNIGWDTKGVLYLLNNPGTHKQKHGYSVTIKNDVSNSKNDEENLDGSAVGIDPTIPEITDCKSLLGDPDTKGSPAFYLVKAFHVIKYVALALMIVLSVMDLTGAVAKQDKDVMAKILKKLMMRFILCIIIFLLPYLLDKLLEYLVERQLDLCGVK